MATPRKHMTGSCSLTILCKSLYSVEPTLIRMPKRKFNPWKVPESAAVTIVGKAKSAIGSLADDLKSVSEQAGVEK